MPTLLSSRSRRKYFDVPFEPTTEDRIWWAIESERIQRSRSLEWWLANACPDLVQVMDEYRGSDYLSHEEGGGA